MVGLPAGSHIGAHAACRGGQQQHPARNDESVILGSVHKKGAGEFTLPGLLEIGVQKVPAKRRRKGINPFTKEEQVFAAKPATVKIKVRSRKKLEDAAL